MEGLEKYRNHGKGIRNKQRRVSNGTYYRNESSCNNHVQPKPYKPAKEFRLKYDMSINRMNAYLKTGYLEGVTYKNKLFVRFSKLEGENP